MNRLRRMAGCVLFFWASHTTLWADDDPSSQDGSLTEPMRVGAYLATGHGTNGMSPYRVGLSWDMGPLLHWPSSHHALHLYWDSAYARWDDAKRRRTAFDNRRLKALTSGPQLRWFAPQSPSVRWFAELGVGFSWLSKREIGGRRLGTHFQFEDRVGAGVLFGERQHYELGVRAVHYSNASIHEHNSGMNMYWVTLGYWF